MMTINEYNRLNALLAPLRVKANYGCPVIVMIEEFGYKDHILICDKPANEVIKWFKRQTFGTTYSYVNIFLMGKQITNRKLKTNEKYSDHKYFDVHDRLMKNRFKNKYIWYSHLFSKDDTFIDVSATLRIFTNDREKHKYLTHRACYNFEEFTSDLTFYDNTLLQKYFEGD